MLTLNAAHTLSALSFAMFPTIVHPTRLKGVNNGATRWIIDTFFSGDWFHISLADITPIDVSFPDVDEIVSRIGFPQSINVKWDEVVPDIDLFYTNLESVSADTIERIEKILSKMKTTTTLTARMGPLMLPEDYDPPHYVSMSDNVNNLEEEVSLYKDKSEASITYFYIR